MSSLRALGPACFFAVCLLLTRWWWAGHPRFFFLVWNLFLALIPVALAALPCRSRVSESLRFIGWILFFPNAPYLITDLLHLTPRPGVPLWFDVGLISTFACAGLLAACLSLRQMHDRVQEWRGEVAGWSFAAMVALLSGFGIWLGRFLRVNSWDALTEPLALAEAAIQPLLHPVLHIRAWGVTLLFGGLLFVVYAGFSSERRVRSPLN